MNKNSRLLTIILSAVAAALFLTAFVLTLILEEEATQLSKENGIMLVGVVVSVVGLIVSIIDKHKMMKLLPVVSFVIFALYVSKFAQSYADAYADAVNQAFGFNVNEPAFLNYPVLNFLALILYVVSAVFMIKDDYKWAKVTFVVTSIFLATVVITSSISLYYLFDTEGLTHVSLYIIAASVLALTPVIAVLVGYLPEPEPQPVEEKVEEEVQEEANEEVENEEDAKAKEKAEIDEEVRKDVEAKFAEAEKKKQEENKESDDEVKLDFGEENN